MERATYTARWIFPVAGPPLDRGTITIAGELIESIEPYGARTPDVDLGNVAIIPGLVNAHTHLDLSGARGKIPPTDPEHFCDWLMGVIEYRKTRAAEEVQEDITNGLTECLHFGTTLLGDIAVEGKSWNSLANSQLRCVVFREMIGLSEQKAANTLADTEQWNKDVVETSICRKGFSPHAPYSAHKSLIVAAGKLGNRCRPKYPTSIHLAETLAEVELLHHRRGPFIPFLKGLGVWDPSGLAESVNQVLCISDFLQPRLFIHGNHISPTSRIPRGSTVVICPRTHSAFGHHLHPFPEFLKRGVNVAIGTDSLASSPDLDLLTEVRCIRERYPDVSSDTILRMATINGAKALGWANECGSLEPGKSADFVTIPLANLEVSNPHDLLIGEAAIEGFRRTMFRGTWRN